MKIAATEEIEIAVARLFDYRRNIIVPNVSWGLGLHECDILIIRKTGYAIEVEIKRSLQDLKNDFKKRHKHWSNKIRYFYYAIPDEYYPQWSELIKDAGIITYELRHEIVYAKIIDRAPPRKCRKLEQSEMLKASHLGCMRIWGLKKRLYNTMFNIV